MHILMNKLMDDVRHLQVGVRIAAIPFAVGIGRNIGK